MCVLVSYTLRYNSYTYVNIYIYIYIHITRTPGFSRVRFKIRVLLAPTEEAKLAAREREVCFPVQARFWMPKIASCSRLAARPPGRSVRRYAAHASTLLLKSSFFSPLDSIEAWG